MFYRRRVLEGFPCLKTSVISTYEKSEKSEEKAEFLCADITMEFSLCLIWYDFNFQKKNQSGSIECARGT